MASEPASSGSALTAPWRAGGRPAGEHAVLKARRARRLPGTMHGRLTHVFSTRLSSPVDTPYICSVPIMDTSE